MLLVFTLKRGHRILKVKYHQRDILDIKERERNINVWLPFARPLLGSWPTTQACALTRNPLVGRPALNPQSHSSQGYRFLNVKIKKLFLTTKTIPSASTWVQSESFASFHLTFLCMYLSPSSQFSFSINTEVQDTTTSHIDYSKSLLTGIPSFALVSCHSSEFFHLGTKVMF